MTYRDLYSTIIGRELDFNNVEDKKIASCLHIYFSDRDNHIIFNGLYAINLDFYRTLDNAKGRDFSTTEMFKAKYLQKVLKERKYSQSQKEMLVGFMSVARKIGGKRDESTIISEMKECYQGSYITKIEEITHTLITDAVRINKAFDNEYMNYNVKIK